MLPIPKYQYLGIGIYLAFSIMYIVKCIYINGMDHEES